MARRNRKGRHDAGEGPKDDPNYTGKYFDTKPPIYVLKKEGESVQEAVARVAADNNLDPASAKDDPSVAAKEPENPKKDEDVPKPPPPAPHEDKRKEAEDASKSFLDRVAGKKEKSESDEPPTEQNDLSDAEYHHVEIIVSGRGRAVSLGAVTMVELNGKIVYVPTEDFKWSAKEAAEPFIAFQPPWMEGYEKLLAKGGN